jgi:hypothetical protein
MKAEQELRKAKKSRSRAKRAEKEQRRTSSNGLTLF